MSKIFNIALAAFLVTLSSQVCASSKLFSNKSSFHLKSEDEETAITLGKSVAYALATLGVYYGATFINVDPGIKIAGTAGVGLIGLGDVSKNSAIKSIGITSLLGALAVWTANGRYTHDIPSRLHLRLSNDNTIERCFNALLYYTLYRSAYILARKGFKHYKDKK